MQRRRLLKLVRAAWVMGLQARGGGMLALMLLPAQLLVVRWARAGPGPHPWMLPKLLLQPLGRMLLTGLWPADNHWPAREPWQECGPKQHKQLLWHISRSVRVVLWEWGPAQIGGPKALALKLGFLQPLAMKLGLLKLIDNRR